LSDNQIGLLTEEVREITLRGARGIRSNKKKLGHREAGTGN